MDVASLLIFTQQCGASDLHLSAGAPPMIRYQGNVRRLSLPTGPAPPIASDDLRRMIHEVLTDAQRLRLEDQKELDFALNLGPRGRFRGNVFYQERGMGAVFRVVPTEIRSCEDLALAPAIASLADLEQGLVLVTGPTGSGKSTTLAAIVDRVNRSRAGHIVTIEDPIEFIHEPKMCMVNQREVGSHTKAFANALRSALREDPDVILVGEMRDLETISLALRAAETGHLVLATLHTASATKTIERIVSAFPAGEQAQTRTVLAECLQAVVAQILLPRRAGGRAVAQEVLVATPGVRAMIRDGKTHQLLSAIQTGSRHGMQSLEQALMQLALNGQVDRALVDRTLATVGQAREEEETVRIRPQQIEVGPRDAPPPPPAEAQRPGAASSRNPKYRYT